MPVPVVQISASVNEKEMTKALDLCTALGTTTLAINPPKMFNFKSYAYLTDVLPRLQKDYPHIRFSLINPEDSTLFALPIPSYHFSNIVDIIKKYRCYLALDIANLDSNILDDEIMRRLKDFLPYLSVVYVSDKSRTGVTHLLPGDGVLKLPQLLQKLLDANYSRCISTKIVLSKSDLSDIDKVTTLLKKARNYFKLEA